MRRVAVFASLAMLGAGCTGQLLLPGASGSGGSGIDPGTGRGGSGTGGSDGTIGQGGRNGSGGAAGGAPLCTAQQVLVPFMRGTADLLLLVGRDSDMSAPYGNTTRMSAVQATLHDIVMANQNAVNFGYLEFPSSRSCANGMACCAQDPSFSVRPSPLSFTAIADALQCNGPVACVADSDSRPVADAFRSAWAVLSSPTAAAMQYVILLTDGAPSCNFNFADDLSTSCNNATTQLNQQLTHNGVTTYVVTVGQDAEAVPCLRTIALNGAGNPSSNPTYQARDPGQLSTALKGIVGDLARGACTLNLMSAPPDLMKVSVKINGVGAIPKDTSGQNGWKYNNNFSVIQVFGDWCRTLQMNRTGDIHIWSGCPP